MSEQEKIKAQGFKDLLVWQKGMSIAKLIYGLTRSFPGEEKFGLVSQMRRAAVSIPSNIAEGQARNGTAEFVLFISYAEGSLAELETQLYLAIELAFCGPPGTDALLALMDEERKMLNALRRKLTAKQLPLVANHLSQATRLAATDNHSSQVTHLPATANH